MANPFKSLNRVISEALGFGLGNVIAPVISPQVQSLVNASWSLHESMPLQALEAAQLVASGERDFAWGIPEAANTGISEARFRALVDMVDTAPDFGTLLEMLRRGYIESADFKEGAKKGNIEDKWLADLEKLRQNFLSPAEAAAARQYGYIDAAKQYEIAALYGIDQATAELQFNSAGMPPSPGEALALLRRGIIKPAEFDQMIREGNTKTKYVDELRALESVPLGLASAVEGVIKTQMTEAEGIAAAAKWGIDAETFKQLVLNSGRPIGSMQAVTLLNRKYFTKADVREVVARSNVRVEYTDAIIELGKHYPTLFQMKTLVAGKAITPAVAKTWLNNNGYADDVAVPLIESWSSATTAHEKDLAKAEILALYEGRIITKAQATPMLAKFGYDTNEIGFLFALADARRSRRFLDSAMTRIHNLYVNRKIDKPTASRDLSALDVQTDAIDDLISIWDDERAAVVLSVTPAQMLRALKLDMVSSLYAYDYLTQLGYADNDARILVSIVKGMGAASEGLLPAKLG